MNLSHLFQRSVQQYGARPALACGTRTALTYTELDQRIRALAWWLRHNAQIDARRPYSAGHEELS